MIILNKFFKYFSIVLLIFIIVFPIKAISFENEEVEDYEISSLLSSLETSSSITTEPETNSTHIIALERNSGRILFEKKAYDKTPMASTTKILTAIIAIEQSNLDSIVTISNKAAHTNGSTLGITKDTQMSMRDLLYGLMLRSRKRLCSSYC